VGARRCKGLHVCRGVSKEQEFTVAHASEHSEPNVPCTHTPHTHTHQIEETGRGKNVRREGKKILCGRRIELRKKEGKGGERSRRKRKKKVKKHKKTEPSHWASLWADPRPPSVGFSLGLAWENVGLCGVPHKHTQKKRRNRKNKKKKKNTKKLLSKRIVEDRIRSKGRK
jgi:hypothetical protein